MATTESSAPAHPPTEEKTPHGCIAGVVYIGHIVEGEDGGEVEVIEAVRCKRCEGGPIAPVR
jgi:hypothetical protein